MDSNHSLARRSLWHRMFNGQQLMSCSEVIMQTGHGKSVDIWSMGCTILEMVTGQVPFSEYVTAAAVMFHIASTNEPPVFPSFVSDLARDFLTLCFERDARKRPSTEQLLQHAWVASVTSPVGMQKRIQLQRQATLQKMEDKSLQPITKQPTSPSHQKLPSPKVAQPPPPEIQQQHVEQPSEAPVEPQQEPATNGATSDFTTSIEQMKSQWQTESISKKSISDVKPKEGYDNYQSIHKFLRQKSLHQSRSFTSGKLSDMLHEFRASFKKSTSADMISSKNWHPSSVQSSLVLVDAAQTMRSTRDDDDISDDESVHVVDDLMSSRSIMINQVALPSNNNKEETKWDSDHQIPLPLHVADSSEFFPVHIVSHHQSPKKHSQGHVQHQQFHMNPVKQEPIAAVPEETAIHSEYIAEERQQLTQKQVEKQIELQEKRAQFEQEQEAYRVETKQALVQKVQQDLQASPQTPLAKKTRANTAPVKRVSPLEVQQMAQTTSGMMVLSPTHAASTKPKKRKASAIS